LEKRTIVGAIQPNLARDHKKHTALQKTERCKSQWSTSFAIRSNPLGTEKKKTECGAACFLHSQVTVKTKRKQCSFKQKHYGRGNISGKKGTQGMSLCPGFAENCEIQVESGNVVPGVAYQVLTKAQSLLVVCCRRKIKRLVGGASQKFGRMRT